MSEPVINYEAERGRRFRYAGAAAIVFGSWSILGVGAGVGPAILGIFSRSHPFAAFYEPVFIVLVILSGAAAVAGLYCGWLAVRFWRQVKGTFGVAIGACKNMEMVVWFGVLAVVPMMLITQDARAICAAGGVCMVAVSVTLTRVYVQKLAWQTSGGLRAAADVYGEVSGQWSVGGIEKFGSLMDGAGGELREAGGVVGGAVGQVGLPTGRVLSYLTNIGTPTRVRIVAGRSALIVGLVEMALCTLGMAALALEIWHVLRWRGFPRPLELLGVGLLLLVGAHSLTLIVLSWPIRRGGREACYAGAVMLAPLTILILLGAALCTAIAIYYGPDVGAVHRVPRPELFWLLAALPIGVLLALLLMDLGGCMMWIARNPGEEKPPVAFVGPR